MKTTTAALLITAAALPLPARAQESVVGTWRVDEVSNAQTPEGFSLTLAFDEQDKATLTYTLPGEPAQSWDYGYRLEGVKLTLEPQNPIGKPSPVEYEVRFEEGRLMLLPPKPEPVEEETDDTAGETEGAAEGEAEGEGAAEPATDEAPAEEGAAEESAAEEADNAEAEGSDEAGTEAEAGDTAETEEEEEEGEAEEEDTRTPVWVLSPVDDTP